VVLGSTKARESLKAELSLKALMAYPDVKIVATFRCLREAVPPVSRV
jgi:hypothetical protein